MSWRLEVLSLLVDPGQPKTVKGSRPEENQVSSTSVPASMWVEPQVAQAAGCRGRR